MSERCVDDWKKACVGKKIDSVSFPLKEGEFFRRISPTSIVTLDYNTSRLNLKVDENDIILDIFWG